MVTPLVPDLSMSYRLVSVDDHYTKERFLIIIIRVTQKYKCQESSILFKLFIIGNNKSVYLYITLRPSEEFKREDVRFTKVKLI